MRHPALFLDRDGVINEEVGFLHRPEEVWFVPGIFSLMLTAQKLGYRLVVVTNQSGIGRGFYSEEDFQALMRWMGEELAREGITIDRIYHCPHHPEGVGVYRRECDDRKPGPGMFLRAGKDLNLDLSASILVGDRLSDMQAGKAAGLRKCFLFSATDNAATPDYRPVSHLYIVEEALRATAAES